MPVNVDGSNAWNSDRGKGRRQLSVLLIETEMLKIPRHVLHNRKERRQVFVLMLQRASGRTSLLWKGCGSTQQPIDISGNLRLLLTYSKVFKKSSI
jgi:hypothetical protein